jgi:type IV secretory pathway VirB10-like protein
MALGLVGIALLLAYAYGGYRRQKQVQINAREAGMPKAVGPATTAAKEFTQAIPVNDTPAAASPPTGQLQPPVSPNPTVGTPINKPNCGFDPRSGQPFKFDSQTGQPCFAQPVQERVVVRQPRLVPQVPPSSPPQPTPEEQRLIAAQELERKARLSPTGILRSGVGAGNPSSGMGSSSAGRSDDLAQIAALAQSLRGTGGRGAEAASALQRAFSSVGNTTGYSDYNGQNMQSRKEAFLAAARSQKADDYLRSTRSAPLGPYEIKAGWEIPAVLEQSLNSDLPGELKALVMSNVYDTATGRFLLIPQGSRLIGRYDSQIAYGQDGLQVVWDRIIYPDASSVDISGMVGLDAHGNAGLRFKVDRHYTRLFGFAALTSLFSAAFDLSQRRRNGGSGFMYPSASDTATAAIGREISQTGAMVTRRNLNVQPTIKVPVGYRFTVRVNQDILFEAPYEPLQADPLPVPSDGGELRRRTSAAIYDQ